ncbi:MAG: hypothetical protein V3S64_10720 [bacterium]
MSYDRVEETYTSRGDAFHKDIGTYDGSLGRLARYEAILERSLTRLLDEYRRIQADRRSATSNMPRTGAARDSRRTIFTRITTDTMLPARSRKNWKNLEGIEAINTGGDTEDTTTRPSPAAGSRKRRERRANHGRNGGNGAAARPPLPHPDGWGPAPGS